MRILDSIQDKGLHKLLLVEEGGEFAVLGQAINRNHVRVQEHLTCEAAKVFWRKVCVSRFYGVTHNLRDAEEMAERRISTIH